MMKGWAMFVKELKVLLRDRGALIQFFLVPVFVMSLANFAMQDMYSGVGVIKLPVVDLDQSRRSGQVVETLKTIDAFTVETEKQAGGKSVPLALADVRQWIAKDHSRSVALVIPAGFEQKLRSGEKVSLVLYENPLEPMGPAMAKGILDLVATRLSANAIAVDLVLAGQGKKRGQAGVQAQVDTIERENARQWEAPPVTIRPESLVHLVGHKIDALKQNVPGFAIMFALFSLIWGSLSIMTERDSGTFARLLSSPVRKVELLGGKLLIMFVVACLQLLVFFAFGHFVFGMDLGHSLLGLVLMSVTLALTTTSLGIFIAAVAKTQAQVSGISSLIILGMSALGGSWWPAEFMPEFMQTLGHCITINAWAMDGYKDLLWYGRGVAAILPEMGVLGLFAVVVFSLGVWRFKFEP